jgi:UDP-galactopyranose mutase
MPKYDYLIVGAGLYGATFAHIMRNKGKKVSIIEKRDHIGGNCYTERVNNIHVHKYGAHIFHTSNQKIWDFINQFTEFNNYVNTPIAFYKGRLYNLPFNMNTFYQLWGVCTPSEAQAKIDEQRAKYAHITTPKNLEEQALCLGGWDIYEKLIKGYSEKQWGIKATEIPSFIIKRLPFRFTYDNNYFNDKYQGIPIGGYTSLFQNMLEGIEVELNAEFLEHREEYKRLAHKIIFTGSIDSYFNYCYGALEYRSLYFDQTVLEDIDNYQGNAVFNYTDIDVPFTRIIEHKHFEFSKEKGTVITKEYPIHWERDKEPFYPINNSRNQSLYDKYKRLSEDDSQVHFGGRLGQYQYYDMDKIIEQAMNDAERDLKLND